MTKLNNIQGYFNSEKSIKIIHYINRLKQKYYMIISIDVEEMFDKTKHPFDILSFVAPGTCLHGVYISVGRGGGAGKTLTK